MLARAGGEPVLRILSLTTVFPNPSEPGLGPFIRDRLRAIAARAEVRVLSPIGPLDYDNPQRRGLGRRSVPFQRTEGRLRICAPAWLYLPGSPFLNGLLLGLQMLFFVPWVGWRRSFDVIDAHFAHPEGVAACLLSRVYRRPFTITMRGSEPRHAGYRWRRILMSWALKRASAVFAVSDPLAGLAAELGARPQAIRTVGNGVDPALFEAACAAARPRRGNSYTIVSAGRLTPRKGHQDVIRAVAGLRAGGVAARLRIIGEAGRGVRSHEPELRQLADDLGVASEVEFAGWMPQKLLAAAMVEADVVCLASEREGWPNIIHEALACGTPVVCYRVGSIPTLVPDERYGFVVPAGDADALQSALDQALRQPWDRSVIAAWGRSRTWEVVAGEVLLVLNRIAGPPAAAQQVN